MTRLIPVSATERVSAHLGWSASTSLGDVIMQILVAEGVKFLSCYPTTPLIEAAARNELRTIVCRQERIGVGIADGYSRMTRGEPPGVFAMQWGPGVENAYSGIATAYSDASPVLILPLGYPDDRLDAPRFYQASHLRSVAKSVERIRHGGDVGAVMRRAFSRLRNGRGGPVVVEVPSHLVNEAIGAPGECSSPVPARPAGDPSAITAAAARLLGARRPVIIAGQGVLYSGASRQLVALAEFLDAPVATTLQGKGAFPESHPLSLGSGGLTVPGALRAFVGEADVILGVGTSFTAHPIAVNPLPMPAADGVYIIHVTIDDGDLDKDVGADCPILGDAGLVLAGLLAEVSAMNGGAGRRVGTAGEVAAKRAAWMKRWSPYLQSDEIPINPYRLVGALSRVLDPAASVITHDSGSARGQMTPFLQTDVPGGYLSWGKSHGLGTGLGLIIGAKLARPEAVCVNVMGDAAFGMVGLDFETAVRNTIPIMTVVLNNGTMAIESESMATSHERFRSRDIGGNYADLAAAMGGWSIRVERPGDLEAALRGAIAANADGQPALVDVVTSPVRTPFSRG
jgi:acetolactate synthase-1/2/3 large subunit